MISPRVDSRQIVIDTVIPILAHIGGPGETNYYSSVTPAAKRLDLAFPLFLRYTRLFYNTPWNEKYAEGLKKKGYPTLMCEDLFRALSDWVEARNNNKTDGLFKAHMKIQKVIEVIDKELGNKLYILSKEIQSIKERLRSLENRSALIKELKEKQSLAKGIELYLSSALGRFSPERFGQEVSWAWFDMATVAGLRDLMGVFMRMYNENTPNSSMFFANL
jgi:uncharacterized protein YllA (UPF0747 family)